MLLNHTDIFYCFSHIHGFQLNVQIFQRINIMEYL